MTSVDVLLACGFLWHQNVISLLSGQIFSQLVFIQALTPTNSQPPTLPKPSLHHQYASVIQHPTMDLFGLGREKEHEAQMVGFTAIDNTV